MLFDLHLAFCIGLEVNLPGDGSNAKSGGSRDAETGAGRESRVRETEGSDPLSHPTSQDHAHPDDRTSLSYDLSTFRDKASISAVDPFGRYYPFVITEYGNYRAVVPHPTRW